MRKVIDVYAAATEHVGQEERVFHYETTFSLCAAIFQKGLYEWKRKQSKISATCTILRNYAFNKGIKSIYYVRTFTDDGGEVGANQ